jgi:hypothetical protein
MKFIVSVVLTAITGFALGLYLDWWSIAIAAFVVAIVVHQGPGKAWLSGFLGIFLLWALLAWWIDMKNQSILATRMAELLPLSGSTTLLILITALVGALVAGFAALTGSFIRKHN